MKCRNIGKAESWRERDLNGEKDVRAEFRL